MTESRRRDPREWLLLATVVVAAFWVGLFGFGRRSDPDYWWHIAVGRHFARAGHLPTVDDWSFSTPDAPWLAHSWLSELALHALHVRSGVHGALVAAGVCLAGIVVLVLAEGWHRRISRLSALVVTLALVASIDLFAYPRPQMIGFTAFALELVLVERFLDNGDFRKLVAASAMIGVWANLHASWILGLAVLSNAAVGGVLARIARGRWVEGWGPREVAGLVAGALAGAGLALVNPAGVGLHAYVFGKASQPLRDQIVEWKPLDAGSVIGVPFVILVLVVVVVLVRRGGPSRPHHALLAAGSAYAAFSCTRYVPFAAIALAMVAVRACPEAAVEPGPARVRPLDVVLLVIALVFPMAFGGRRYDEAEDGTVPAILRRHAGEIASHRTFHEFDWGGFLVWQEDRPHAVFIDGRADHFISGGVFEDYLAAYRAGPRVDEVLDKYRIDALLVRPSAPILQYAIATGRCVRVWGDDAAVFADCSRSRR